MEIHQKDLIKLCKTVGNKILLPNWGLVSAEIKDDGTFVSVVDKKASQFIIDGLARITPEIPVISEEASVEENIISLKSPLRWVIDPLDGTSHYLKGPNENPNASFGIHIGLVEHGKATRGFAYFPARKEMYFTADNGLAYLQVGEEDPKRIVAPSKLKEGQIRASVPENTTKRPSSINNHDYIPIASIGGGQICIVASGQADLVWQERADKPGPLEQRDVFSHWDVVAAHAIIKAAGGNLYEMATHKETTYDNPSFLVAPCVAGNKNLLKQIGFNTSDRDKVPLFNYTL